MYTSNNFGELEDVSSDWSYLGPYWDNDIVRDLSCVKREICNLILENTWTKWILNWNVNVRRITMYSSSFRETCLWRWRETSWEYKLEWVDKWRLWYVSERATVMTDWLRYLRRRTTDRWRRRTDWQILDYAGWSHLTRRNVVFEWHVRIDAENWDVQVVKKKSRSCNEANDHKFRALDLWELDQ